MIEFKAENIYIIGDTHNFKNPYELLAKHYKFKNFIMIHVGDIGVGVDAINIDKSVAEQLNEYCIENNGIFIGIRGNHDDPSLFGEQSVLNQSNVHFVSDYTYMKINNKVCLFAGGAISIDRIDREIGVDYWIDEPFKLPENYIELPQCDVLITHSSPINFQPNDGLGRIRGVLEKDPPLKNELIKERDLIQRLVDHINCSQVYYGHFHEVFSEYVEGVYARCLDINEVLDVTYNFI